MKETSFNEVMLESPCYYCDHLLAMGKRDNTGWTCKAFPKGIPIGIMNRKIDHREELKGVDNGFTYEGKVFTNDDGTEYKLTFKGDVVKVKK